MSGMFALQCYELFSEPEFESYYPTYDFEEEEFEVGKSLSMIAVELEGRTGQSKQYLDQEEVDKQLRVSFRFKNGTYVDAVYCNQLYSELIEEGEQSDSLRGKILADKFKDTNYVCPNVTSTKTITNKMQFKAQITSCNYAKQTVYA